MNTAQISTAQRAGWSGGERIVRRTRRPRDHGCKSTRRALDVTHVAEVKEIVPMGIHRGRGEPSKRAPRVPREKSKYLTG